MSKNLILINKMKTSIFLLLLFFVTTADGQEAIRRYYDRVSDDKENERENRKLLDEYTYDEESRLVEQVTKLWDADLGRYVLNSKEENVYENGNLVLQEIYTWQEEIDDWTITVRKRYQFSEAGCLVYIEAENFWDPERISTAKIKYINNFDCSEPWKSTPHTINWFWDRSYIVNRIRTDSVELEEMIYVGDGTSFLIGKTERTYNHEGQLLRYYNSFTDSSYELYIHEYNENHKISKTQFLFAPYGTNDFELDRILSYDYLYQDDLLIEETRTTTWYEPNGDERVSAYTQVYDYYCDGLLKQWYRKIDWSFGGWSEETQTFEYAQASDCEAGEEIDFSVYPNPYDDYVIIESDLLQRKGTVVNIYQGDGKLIWRSEMTERLSRLMLDLPQIGDGFLVVNIIFDGQSYSKKIVPNFWY